MNMGKYLIGIALLAAVILPAGCGKEKPAPPDADARAAARNMFTLLFDGSRERFLACFTGTPYEIKVVSVMFDFTRSSAEFRDSFIKTYGKAAWETADTSASRDKDIVLKDIAKAQLTLDGDNATMVNTSPGSTRQNPLLLVKVDGVWMVRASSLQPAGDNAAQAVQAMQTMASIMTKYRKAIGKPGIRPEDIKIELRRTFEEQVGGKTSPEPHLFDIDKIK
jgi:hypothetical protein